MLDRSPRKVKKRKNTSQSPLNPFPPTSGLLLPDTDRDQCDERELRKLLHVPARLPPRERHLFPWVGLGRLRRRQLRLLLQRQRGGRRRRLRDERRRAGVVELCLRLLRVLDGRRHVRRRRGREQRPATVGAGRIPGHDRGRVFFQLFRFLLARPCRGGVLREARTELANRLSL